MRWNRVFETPYSQRRYTLVLLTVALGFALSVAAFSLLLNFERHEIKEDFERTASDKALALESSIATNVEALQDIKSFYAASKEVERDEFRTFVEHALGEHPGIQALEWIPRVLAA